MTGEDLENEIDPKDFRVLSLINNELFSSVTVPTTVGGWSPMVETLWHSMSEEVKNKWRARVNDVYVKYEPVNSQIKSIPLEISIIIENPILRRNISWIMRRRYRDCIIHEASTILGMQRILKKENDIIVCVTHIGDTSVVEYTKAIRNGHNGMNRFPIIIMLMYDAIEYEVYKVFSCGPDAVLLMPVSSQQIFDRLDYFEKTRKKFVALHNYIGPDRRANHRMTDDIPMFDVPNPIRNKINGITTVDVNKQIVKFEEDLVDARVISCQSRLSVLVGEMTNLHNSDFDLSLVIKNSSEIVKIIKTLNTITKKWDSTVVDSFMAEILRSVNALLAMNGKSTVERIEDLLQA